MFDLWMRAGRYWMNVAVMQQNALLTIAARQPILYKEMMAAPAPSPESARMVWEKLFAAQEIGFAAARAMFVMPTGSPHREAARSLRSAERYLKPLSKRTRANARRLGRKRSA